MNRLINKILMYRGSIERLHKLMAHRKRWVNKHHHLLTTILTNTWEKYLFEAASQINPCWFCFFTLVVVYSSRKIEEEVNNNPTEKPRRAFSFQLLSSHAYQGHLRAQSSARNRNCGWWWDFTMEMWATRTPGLKFSTRNRDQPRTHTHRRIKESKEEKTTPKRISRSSQAQY